MISVVKVFTSVKSREIIAASGIFTGQDIQTTVLKTTDKNTNFTGGQGITWYKQLGINVLQIPAE